MTEETKQKNRDRANKWHRDNREKHLEAMREYRQQNLAQLQEKERERSRKKNKLPEVKEQKHKWYLDNQFKSRERMKRRYLLNKQEYLERAKLWRSKNPEKTAYYTALRRALHKNATPKWLTREQKNEMKQFYVLAKELRWLSEEPLHVDHIIPLDNELVCGLHVPWNLQLLLRSENFKKGNRL